MGGFAGAFTKIATEGIEAAGAKLGSVFRSPTMAKTAEHVADNVETGLYHAIFKPEAAFQTHPAAQKLWQMYSGPYHELTNKYASEGVEAAKAAGSIKPSHEIESEARRKASDQVFGPKRQVIQGVLHHIANTDSYNKADILADHFNVLFKEAPMEGGRSAGLSKFDTDMRSGKGAKFESKPSKYQDRNMVERVANVHQRLLAYKAAIPHLTSNLNIMLSDGFSTYAKSLAQTFGPGRKAAEAMVLASNSISELNMNGYREKQAFENGLIKKFAPGSVGEFIHRNMFIPGMNSVRYNTLLMSAHASKFAAEEAAQHLIQGNDRMAGPMFKELGIDMNKIKQQGGKLLPEDIDKAYYHGTNSRAFLNQRDKRSILWQQSPLFRTMTAFHSYVANQASFLNTTFRRQYAQGDHIGIARNIALMSTVFPVLGATIYESERLLSGNDWDDPAGHLGKRVEATPLGLGIDALTGRENGIKAGQSAMAMIENLSHLASFGVATGYIRGASRAHLASQILGPDATMLIQGVEDTFKAAHTDNRHPDSWKPLARDAMADTPSLGIGSILSHKLLPTAAEKKRSHPTRSRRTHPKPESNNPLNMDDLKY